MATDHLRLSASQVSLRISSECRHDRASSLLPLPPAGASARGRPELVSVKSTSGWSFELQLKPGTTDSELFDKYNICGAVQDNWFVLGAVLKDQFGVQIEEDNSARPSCLACRRSHLALTLTLTKVF
jgi:hypothetical protein